MAKLKNAIINGDLQTTSINGYTPLGVISQGGDSSNGYWIYYSNKLLECWGTKLNAISSDGNTSAIYLPGGMSYGNTNWSITIGPVGANDACYYGAAVNGNNNFVLYKQHYGNNSVQSSFRWHTIGFVS